MQHHATEKPDFLFTFFLNYSHLFTRCVAKVTCLQGFPVAKTLGSHQLGNMSLGERT